MLRLTSSALSFCAAVLISTAAFAQVPPNPNNPNENVPEKYAYTPYGENIKLDQMGLNRNGLPVKSLVVDTVFLAAPEMASFNVKTRTNHRQKSVNILFTDGHVTSPANRDDRFTVDARNYNELRDSFSKILQVFEQADAEP